MHPHHRRRPPFPRMRLSLHVSQPWCTVMDFTTPHLCNIPPLPITMVNNNNSTPKPKPLHIIIRCSRLRMRRPATCTRRARLLPPSPCRRCHQDNVWPALAVNGRPPTSPCCSLNSRDDVRKINKKRVIVKLFKLMDKTGYPVLSDPDNNPWLMCQLLNSVCCLFGNYKNYSSKKPAARMRMGQLMRVRSSHGQLMRVRSLPPAHQWGYYKTDSKNY